MRFAKLITLFFVITVFSYLISLILNYENDTIHFGYNEKRHKMYRSSTSFYDNGEEVKKVMFSYPIKKCRINIDILSFPGKSLKDHLQIHLNYELESCKLEQRFLDGIVEAMLLKIKREWNFFYISQILIQKPSIISRLDIFFKKIGYKFRVKKENKNNIIYERVN